MRNEISRFNELNLWQNNPNYWNESPHRKPEDMKRNVGKVDVSLNRLEDSLVMRTKRHIKYERDMKRWHHKSFTVLMREAMLAQCEKILRGETHIKPDGEYNWRAGGEDKERAKELIQILDNAHFEMGMLDDVLSDIALSGE